MIIVHKIIIYLALISIFLSIIMTLDYKHWNGIEKKNDKTLLDKLINRLYFLTTTFSTTGYGDITPKSKIAKILTMCIHIITILGIVKLILSEIIPNKVICT